jgi:hypothetical protein
MPVDLSKEAATMLLSIVGANLAGIVACSALLLLLA